LELSMVIMLAGRVALVQYRLMRAFSLAGDVMLAQITLKNVVLLVAVLIFSYGLFVPKSWQRGAWVLGPVALLPFTIVVGLTLESHSEMSWLWADWRKSSSPRAQLFTYDALLLLILAVGSTFGARASSRLRRQVVEARQLGHYRLRRLIGAGGM